MAFTQPALQKRKWIHESLSIEITILSGITTVILIGSFCYLSYKTCIRARLLVITSFYSNTYSNVDLVNDIDHIKHSGIIEQMKKHIVQDNQIVFKQSDCLDILDGILNIKPAEILYPFTLVKNNRNVQRYTRGRGDKFFMNENNDIIHAPMELSRYTCNFSEDRKTGLVFTKLGPKIFEFDDPEQSKNKLDKGTSRRSEHWEKKVSKIIATESRRQFK